ncbi:MAG: hypothetical protein ACC662_03985 [Planctomycetota bacterium]
MVDEQPLEVSGLSVVVFQCRSLERRLLKRPFSLRDDEGTPSDHEPPEVHVRSVRSTMDQFSSARLPEYLPRLQADGNRESHYRETHVEATLVFDLRNQQPKAIQRFIEMVDGELPGAYCWFRTESLHMTVRGLA